MNGRVGQYIDHKVIQEIHAESELRQYMLDQTGAPPNSDSLGIVSSDGSEVTIPSGDSFSGVVIGTPNPLDATVRLAGNRAVRLQEHTNYFLSDKAESWFIPLWDFDSGTWDTDMGWWLKDASQDVAYRIPYELLPTLIGSEYGSLAPARTITFDSSGQHLILTKMQMFFENPYNTNYFSTNHRCGGGALPSNPVSSDLSIVIQYALFNNWYFDGDTDEVASDDIETGTITIHAEDYLPNSNPWPGLPLEIAHNLVATGVVRTPLMQLEYVLDEDTQIVVPILSLAYTVDASEYAESQLVDGSPEGSCYRQDSFNHRTYYVNRIITLGNSPEVSENSINSSVIFPLLDTTESSNINDPRINSRLDYAHQGRFAIRTTPANGDWTYNAYIFAGAGNSPLLFFRYEGPNPGGSGIATLPLVFNNTTQVFYRLDDLPVNLGTLFDVIGIYDEAGVVGSLVEFPPSVATFYPTNFKKVEFTEIDNLLAWRTTDVIENVLLNDDFTPADLRYTNRTGQGLQGLQLDVPFSRIGRQ